MAERIFFEYEDVKVTNARFISGSQTYAMNNVTSVKVFEQTPRRFWPILLLVLGLLIAIAAPVVGLIVVAAAAVYLFMQKTIYHVMLATSGGETSALSTYQQAYLQDVVSALNEAIVHRG